MKRYFKMLAAGILTLSLAGCGSGSASDSSSSSGAAESKPAAAETPEAAAEWYKALGYIFGCEDEAETLFRAAEKNEK